MSTGTGEPSEAIRERVLAARAAPQERVQGSAQSAQGLFIPHFFSGSQGSLNICIGISMFVAAPARLGEALRRSLGEGVDSFGGHGVTAAATRVRPKGVKCNSGWYLFNFLF